jgi:PAS domain S-box-containing protein
MGTPGATPIQQANDRLSEQVIELEAELTRLRQSLAEIEQPNPSKPQSQSDQYYKEVFDHLSVCMFFVDVTSDRRFRYAGFNPAEEEALGLSSEQVTGKYVEEVFAPDLARKLVGNYHRCVEAGRTITFDDELNLPAGRRYFHSNLIPLRDSAGEIHRIVGACIDTTDHKRTQEEALSTQKLESLGVLAAGIAHDFNNLLGSILAEAELAETELSGGGSPKEEIRTIQGVATRAAEIVRELMIYAGQDSTTLEPTDVSLLVQEMLELLRISISKHAKLRVDLPRHLPAIQANPAQLRQVIMNLITNASEALEEKEGVISLSVGLLRAKEPVGDGPSTTGDCLRLVIADSGCGMTPEILSKIFDPFYTTKFSGRGLGLAAVQGIIRSHHGAINVTSVPGQGSQFEILLPVAAPPPEAPQRETTSPEERLGTAGSTVLLIEDEDVLRHAVAAMLQKHGFHVIEASDGAAGRELFEKSQKTIDVVLLDATLPTMSSSEVYEAIRGVRPDVRVILTSAYSMDIGGDKAPWGFIRKPYRFHELCEMVGRASQNSLRTQ